MSSNNPHGVLIEDSNNVVIRDNVAFNGCDGTGIQLPGDRLFEGCPVDEDGKWVTPHDHFRTSKPAEPV